MRSVSLEHCDIVDWKIVVLDPLRRNVIELILQADVKLVPAAECSDQDVASGPVDPCQALFNTYRQSSPFKGRIRGIGDQLVQHSSSSLTSQYSYLPSAEAPLVSQHATSKQS